MIIEKQSRFMANVLGKLCVTLFILLLVADIRKT